ncbi:type II toxin-antitoxin system VapC family toxin [Sphingomonas oligophenolica]|uniref:PIN domain-containing protein n=1 Tax=Sphingomonas oligophenolica TaxID=301154 RepID=A0A502CF46_9SPHN|nr:type II toxin-antitoxin system VapC family toxin [Sphingomonas oligophenolica]TPG10406.1 PIN domain-containing protein [Sphingomonas oligophenolica]
MNVLLDTHVLVWLIEAPGRFDRAERRILERAQHSTYISVVSLWEIRIKWESIDRRGRRKGSVDPRAALAFVRSSEIMIARLDEDIAVASLEAATANRDPFDELLLVHAQELRAKLLTRDGTLLDHPLALRP